MMVTKENELFTCFPTAPTEDEIPAEMPSPFSNTPHPLAEQASLMLQQRLSALPQDIGKMFGVLVVQNLDGAIGFLSAFSGMMGGKWQIPGFVPPIFDQAEHDSFLPAARDELNIQVEQLQILEESSRRCELQRDIAVMQQQRSLALAELKQQHKDAKAMRKFQRLKLQTLPDSERQTHLQALALASQRQKREFTNASLHWDEKLQLLQHQLDGFEQQIRQIRQACTERSRQLHKQVFATYLLDNRLHEQRPITDFFEDALPPAGTGDCAGPKLIHFAHQHQLQPLALAEFWWGASPSTGVRHHGHYYPACRGKCRPILPFMLRGLNVEPEPDYAQEIDADEPTVVYDDDDLLVVNKPAGLMSAPGKHIKDSVFTRLRLRYPDSPELKLVHRLDMATSGLLLLAKNMRANKFLQKQFIQHKVEKRYEALLSKRLSSELLEGDIDLPLRVDLDDRPRQMVCYEHGKPAQTHWQVISFEGDATRIWFYPHTGRTHQLRVHASHKDGLNAAIVGDALYGQADERLMLHAQRLCFIHPVSREHLEFEVPAPF
ncbi:tRNA pseudouridine32 synthase / 23S rRNA pseudouridine746 synthase [Mariprofundus micogutta]|uniref:tRNA pseudouridine32 synthase / 23S rRNA pseudouridine746 synthase n=1 Tax=Mariprofundus micogutta TaxID=1921010 RepID=A0A1L8CK74_9PROT|nr:RluA family pseudouridine synthase [Mariprofundus micogutta]GAV19324.1 tRNA pseudouridine32 synthase / 23S rRNA pseudouridine746 synthase [Mariprofundus micogutta]